MSVRWGILSTARINQKILAGARESPLVEIVAVAARDLDRARRYARDNGIERAYGRYADLLADPDVQAVYISVPNSMHVEWAIRALEAGKHVLCEKPLSRRVADVEAAFDVADRSGRLLMEAYMYRHHPQTAELVDAVATGSVGELRLIRAVYGYNLLRTLGPGGHDVRLDPRLDGGALQDLGCYCVSVARMLAGEPERVYGVQRLGGSGVDILFAGTLEFADAVVAQFECTFATESRAELEVVGTDGRLVVPEPFRIEHPRIELVRADAVEEITCETADSYRLELENLSAAIEGDAKPLLGRGDAFGQARAIEALFESAAKRQPIVLAARLSSRAV